MRRNNRGASILRDYLGDEAQVRTDDAHPYDYQPSSGSPINSAQASPDRSFGSTTRLNGGSVDSSRGSKKVDDRLGVEGSHRASSFGSHQRGSRDSSSSSVRRRKVELANDYSIDDEASIAEDHFDYQPNSSSHPQHQETNTGNSWTEPSQTPPRLSDRVSNILSPLTEIDSVPNRSVVPLSPFSPMVNRKRRRQVSHMFPPTTPGAPQQRSVTIDWKDEAIEDLSLSTCRKVSVVVTVSESHAAGGSGTAMGHDSSYNPNQHVTPKHSNESNQICIFPLMEDVTSQQSLKTNASQSFRDSFGDELTYTAIDSHGMIVVNPTAFGKQIPVSVTMDTARLVAQKAKVSSEDWARTYKFKKVLWSSSIMSHNDKIEALYNICLAVVNDLLAPGSIAHRILLGAATGASSGSLQTSQLFGAIGQQSIARVFSESGVDMSVEYMLDQFGLVGLTVHKILQRIEAANTNNTSMACTLSILEVSGEDALFDLLASKPFSVKGGTQVKFKYEDNGAAVTGLSEASVDSVKGAGLLMRRAFTAALHKNRRSGRGHIIITVNVFSTLNPKKRTSCQFVDLAAVEQGDGDMAARRNSIKRKSLSALGAVLRGTLLKEAGNDTPISYRDSLLTKVLQRTMVQTDTRVVVLSTVSPDTDQYQDTMATIRFLDLLVNRPGQVGGSPFSTLNRSQVSTSASQGASDAMNLSMDQFPDEEKGVLLREFVADPRQRLAKVMLPPQSPEIGTQAIGKYTPTKYMNPLVADRNHKAILRDQGSILSTSPRESEPLFEGGEHWPQVDSTLPTPLAGNVGASADALSSLHTKHPSLDDNQYVFTDRDTNGIDNAHSVVYDDPDSDDNAEMNRSSSIATQSSSKLDNRMLAESRPSYFDVSAQNKDIPTSDSYQRTSGNQVVPDSRGDQVQSLPFNSGGLVSTNPFDPCPGDDLEAPTGKSDQRNSGNADGDSQDDFSVDPGEGATTQIWEYDDISHLSQPSRSFEDVESANHARAQPFAEDELECILLEQSHADENDSHGAVHSVALQSTDKSLESLLREPDLEPATAEAFLFADIIEDRLRERPAAADKIAFVESSGSAAATVNTRPTLSAGNGTAQSLHQKERSTDALILNEDLYASTTYPLTSSSSRFSSREYHETAGSSVQSSKSNRPTNQTQTLPPDRYPAQTSFAVSDSGDFAAEDPPGRRQTTASVAKYTRGPEALSSRPAHLDSILLSDDDAPLTTYDLPPDSPAGSPQRPEPPNSPHFRNVETTTTAQQPRNESSSQKEEQFQLGQHRRDQSNETADSAMSRQDRSDQASRQGERPNGMFSKVGIPTGWSLENTVNPHDEEIQSQFRSALDHGNRAAVESDTESMESKAQQLMDVQYEADVAEKYADLSSNRMEESRHENHKSASDFDSPSLVPLETTLNTQNGEDARAPLVRRYVARATEDVPADQVTKKQSLNEVPDHSIARENHDDALSVDGGEEEATRVFEPKTSYSSTQRSSIPEPRVGRTRTSHNEDGLLSTRFSSHNLSTAGTGSLVVAHSDVEGRGRTNFTPDQQVVPSLDAGSFRHRNPAVDQALSRLSEYRSMNDSAHASDFNAGHTSERTVLAEIDQLQADVDKVKQTNLSVWQSSLASFDNLRSFLSTQKAAIAQLAFDRDRALQESKRLEKELERQSEAHRHQTMQLKGEIEAVRNELNKAEIDRVEVLKIAEDAITTQAEHELHVKEVEQELVRLSKSTVPREVHDDLQSRHQYLEQRLDDANKEIERYTEELRDRNAMIAELNEASRKTEAESRKYRDDLKARETEVEELTATRETAREAQVEVSSLRNQMAKLSEELQSVQSAGRQREAELLLEHKAAMDFAEQSKRAAESAILELNGVQEKLQAESTEQHEEVQSLLDKLDRMKEEAKISTSKLREAEQEILEQHSIRSTEKQELDQTRASLESRISDVQKLMSNLTQLVAEKEKDQAKIAKMEKTLSSFQDETRSRVEMVVHHRNDAVELLAKTVDENKALEESNRSLQSVVEALQLELDSVKMTSNRAVADRSTGTQTDDVTKENLELRLELDILRRELGRTSDRHSTTAQRLSALENRDPLRRDASVFTVRDIDQGRPPARWRHEELSPALEDRQELLGRSSSRFEVQRAEDVAAEVAFAAKAELELRSVETDQIKEKLFALEDAKDEEISSLKSRIKTLERRTMARTRGI